MENIIENNICDQYIEDVERYSMYVNRRRFIPDVKDGLKPVQRRIIWAAYKDTKCIDTRAKSARLVGDAMGRYHPHGDAGVYNAMKPMTNWFETYIPLLEGRGNWGTFQGSPQSAARYTETKLSKFALEGVIGLLKEVNEVVDWDKTYNEETIEPVYLPVEVPLLLINGSFGMGYGIAVNIPKHNINEVIDATIYHIYHPNENVVIIPDTCMECEIIDTDFKTICSLGYGKYTVRGKIDIENDGKKNILVIKSVPDLTYLDTIIDKIEDLVEKKQLPQISKIIDISEIDKEKKNNGKDIMKFVIELKPGADPNYVRDIIYKNTKMQDTVSVNMRVLYNYNPIRISYREYIDIFLDFRKETLIRYYNNKLKKTNTKLHEMDAYVKLLESNKIDEIIDIIRHNDKNDEELSKTISEMLNITEFQCKYIINRDLKKLSKYYLDRYIQERESLRKEAEFYEFKITNEQSLLEDIVKQLEYYKKKYGKPRNSKIISKAEMCSIPQGRFKLIITQNNYIKKIPVESNSIGSFKDDKPTMMIEGDNSENILIFTREGKVFKLPIHNIPLSDLRSNGTLIHMISKKIFGNIVTVMYEPALKELTKKKTDYYISVLTSNGFIKRMSIDDFLAVPPSGIIYSKLEKNDYVSQVTIINNRTDIVLYNWTNKALRLNINDIPYLKRSTKGNMTFSNLELGKNQINGISIIKPNDTDLLVITDNGKINRLSIAALPCGNRNTTGNKVIKLGKSDIIKYILSVNENNSIYIQTQSNRYNINVSDIEFGSSMSSGNKFINKNEHIIECGVI